MPGFNFKISQNIPKIKVNHSKKQHMMQHTTAYLLSMKKMPTILICQSPLISQASHQKA